MTYATWRFAPGGLSELSCSFYIDNDPGPDSHLFLQLYDGSIDGTPTYHGVQTIDLAIFSRFGTTDLGEVRAAPGATKVAGSDEGTFVSLRKPLDVDVGHYTSSVRRAEADRDGDWFEFAVGPAEKGEEVVGAIRFPRRYPDVPAAIADVGGSWTECWDNNGPVLHEVPLWGVRLDPPRDARGRQPEGVSFSYSTMPNSAIWWDEERGQVVTVIGGDTRRRRAPTVVTLAGPT